MATKKQNLELDIVAWSDSWLKTAGCNIIWHEVEEKDGKITKFTVHQECNEHGETNQLRVQRYNLAFYDEKMEIIQLVNIFTKANQKSFTILDLEGK